MSGNGQLPHDWELGVENLPLEDIRLLRENYTAVAEAFRRRQIGNGQDETFTAEELYSSLDNSEDFSAGWNEFVETLEYMADSRLPVSREKEGYRAIAGYSPSDWERILDA